MLASLTGLLLTLGGDQPAVVFDPPLDPAIFDWDPETLTLSLSDEYQPDDSYFCCKDWFVDLPVMIIHRPVLYSPPFIRETGANPEDGDPCRDDNIPPFILNGSYKSGSDFSFGRETRVLLPQQYEVGRICFACSDFCRLNFKYIFFEINAYASQSEVNQLKSRVDVLEQSLESCQCASDLDGDGAVGFTDLVELISVWGPCSA